MLAIRHKLIDTLIEKMIEDAQKQTSKLNNLLQFIDFFCESGSQN